MSDEILKKLNEHDKKFAQLGEQIDSIAIKVVEHDEQLRDIRENMATKDDIRGLADTMDKLLKLSIKRDEENTMTTHGMKRHEERIEKLEKGMKQINPAFGMS